MPVHEALLAEIYQVQSAIGQMTLELYRRRACARKVEVRRPMRRAFDTAVRRNPLGFAADAVSYGI